MIRKFFTELLQELGITLPERKKKEAQIVNEFTQGSQFSQDFNFAETWEVRWISRHGRFSGDTRPEVAGFSNEGDALVFATAIRDAYKMLRHTSDTEVYMEQRKI